MQTLFEQLGEENLALLVDRFYDQVFSHDRISRLFKTDKALTKEKQRMFLTQFLGGPPLYSQRYGHPQLQSTTHAAPYRRAGCCCLVAMHVNSIDKSRNQ